MATLTLILLCAIAAAVFATIRWLCAGRPISPWMVDFLSLGFAFLVLLSQSIFGWKIT